MATVDELSRDPSVLYLFVNQWRSRVHLKDRAAIIRIWVPILARAAIRPLLDFLQFFCWASWYHGARHMRDRDS